MIDDYNNDGDYMDDYEHRDEDNDRGNSYYVFDSHEDDEEDAVDDDYDGEDTGDSKGSLSELFPTL